MKIFYRPYVLNLTTSLLFLLLVSHYILFCFYQEITFLSYDHLQSYLEKFYPIVFLIGLSAYSLWNFKWWGLVSLKLSFIVLYCAKLTLFWGSFSKANVFYLVFLGIILFFFYSIARDEIKKASYQTNFLKNSLRKELGKSIVVSLSGEARGQMIYWDEQGGVIEFNSDPNVDGKSIKANVSFQGSDYEVIIGPVIYCTEQKRLSFRFLSSAKNSATLMLVRKLERMGWKPERLV